MKRRQSATHRDESPWFRPQWPVPDSVGALMSTRRGGVGQAPFDSLNLKADIGDDPVAVAENRARHARRCSAIPVWLNQVHGACVARLTQPPINGLLPEADASVTTQAGLACSILVADCMPVLLAARNGRAVAAAHAGWRGLAGGVAQAAVIAVCNGAHCDPGEVVAWLGPAIGPRAFEVGADVLRAFGEPATAGREAPRFKAVAAPPSSPPKWLADLPGLVRERLRAAGVNALYGNDGSAAWCTVGNPSDFFSFRRDGGVTGRLAASVWLLG